MTTCWKLLCVISVFLILDSAYCINKNYCNEKRTRTRSKTVVAYRRCGFFLRRQCCYYKRVYYTETYEVKKCCDGWRGCYCHIPICDPPCVPGKGVCVDKDTCKCVSLKQGGATCDTERCTFLDDCYPGVCVPPESGSQSVRCQCELGFSGDNCNKVDTGPVFNQCKVQLQRWKLRKLVSNLDVDCNLQDITSGDQATSVFSNLRDFTRMNLKWTVEYRPEVPTLTTRPAFVTNYDVGIASARVVVYLNNIKERKKKIMYTRPCTGVSPSNPRRTHSCQVDYDISSLAVREGFELEVSFEATTGGQKIVRRQVTRYSGTSFSKKVKVVFDTNKPYHCTEFDSCDQAYTDEPIAFGLDNDITNKTVTFIIFGWNDTTSKIDRFQYEVMKMQKDLEGLLRDGTSPVAVETWRYGQGEAPEYTPPGPGMYNIKLSVIDHANNTAKARTLLLYDPDSKVTVNSDKPIRVTSAYPGSNYTWLGAGSRPTRMTVDWTDHFENKVHHENSLLNPVKPVPAGVIEDTEGRRTTAGIPNARGIVKFSFESETRSGSGNIKLISLGNIQQFGPQKTEHTQTFKNLQDGDGIDFRVTAADIFDRSLTDTLTVYVDHSHPAILGVSHQVNQDYELSLVNLATVITVKTRDLHSGIHEITYKLLDRTSEDVVLNGSIPGSRLTNKVSVTDYCIVTGDCFAVDHLIHIDHCELQGRQGHHFEFDFRVVNQAGLFAEKIYQMGSRNDLRGVEENGACGVLPGSQLTGGAIAGIVIFVLLLLLLCVCCGLCLYRKRKGKRALPRKVVYVTNIISERLPWRGKSERKAETTGIQSRSPAAKNDYIEKAEWNNGYDSDESTDSDEIYAFYNMNPYKPDMVVSRDQVTYVSLLKEGKFANILLATVKEKYNKNVTVVAKRLKDNAGEGDKMLMNAKKNFLMKITRNDYLVNLYGVIPAGPVLLLEHCEGGTLKDWLDELTKLTPEEHALLSSFGIHIAKGMRHLHREGVLHRRLAARNILLTTIAGELHAKVAGFGPLPGDKFEREHGKGGASNEGRLPVKWMAPESLEGEHGSLVRVYTKATDVWSFGVVLWEIFSLGDTPYDVKTRRELLDWLNSGRRLHQPDYASDNMHDVMMTCWEQEPAHRPSMESLVETLDDTLFPSRSADNEYYG